MSKEKTSTENDKYKGRVFDFGGERHVVVAVKGSGAMCELGYRQCSKPTAAVRFEPARSVIGFIKNTENRKRERQRREQARMTPEWQRTVAAPQT